MRKVIVVGSGIAALAAIQSFNEQTEIYCITKDKLNKHNSSLAQGGICCSQYEHDNGHAHIVDTYKAGNKLGDIDVIQSIIQHSHCYIEQLIQNGLSFDTITNQHVLDFAMEGAHTRPRILHIGGDQTGKYLTHHLMNQLSSKHIKIYEETEVIDLLKDTEHAVCGVRALDKHRQQLDIIAHDVILATGGYSNLFPTHSSASSSISSGHVIAHHHGIPSRHMEMIQFHPTLLGKPGQTYGLVSEAVRGHGGILVNSLGDHFMKDKHPLGSLAPRDVTSRAIFQQQQLGHQCFINIEQVEAFSNRFPTIYQNVIEHFPDEYAHHLIPITPGAHYTMGGVKTDIYGRTNLSHFYVIGEASNTNFHGANRLASNSLLEALVMGHLCGEAIHQSEIRDIHVSESEQRQIPKISDEDIQGLRQQTFKVLGIERNGSDITAYLNNIQDCLSNAVNLTEWTQSDWQKYIEVKTLEMISISALSRSESRGVHYRLDYPNTEPTLQHTDIEILMEDSIHAKQVIRPRKTQTILP
ncbi:L-aspartate oxidase [Mammaliicoccus sciuri]|uniref:L-aspartate oxidase n=1 Tax=Mammaliicoccus sciuri TaxID=1296 RepID=UPI00132FB3FC|nr:FAD-binding protein [Mammaliicoccus sciuri]